MKTLLSVIVGCAVLLGSLPQLFAQGPNACQLVRAQWGAGNRTWDVTQRVQAMIQGNQLSFKVNNTNLGGDPAPEQKKNLVIVCQGWRGQNTFNYREGDYVNMQMGGNYRNLRVISATWGIGDRTWNVTDRVNGMINADRLSFKVNNTNLGGDPAPDRHKQLTMTWIYSGRQGRRVWREGEYVNLP